MLNIGSFLLGICAWLFAGLAISSPKAVASYRNTSISFGLCVISLALQMFEINRRVLLGDYTAIEDTIQAVLAAAVVLILVTIALNLLALLKVKKKEANSHLAD